MVTTVGHEGDIKSLVRDLILLENDAIAAYETAIDKLSDKSLATQVAAFRKDHLHHLDVLREMARELAFDPPQSGDIKEFLTTGKVALASLAGDSAILKAMKSNENDTVTAYRRAAEHGEAVEKSKVFFAHALADEERHRAWMETTAANL
ncbi:ferritin-like domain-containing protein [Aurantimonas sp. A2-1-M11]|uniref:ferritin-like domain-containing protein n=1 Tax=Aurantimonas sp. A2-1-M11 TaxID=3113712 RepID=UPI002F933E91